MPPMTPIAKSQRDGSLKSLSLQQYQQQHQQRQRHQPEDNSAGMVELDGPSDNMSYQQTTNQTTNIINITNISKSFTSYNNICKPNLATISFDGSKNDNINKDNYSDNNNSCNDTISVYNKVKEYNRINGSKLCYSVVDPYIRAMTAPSRPVKSSKLSPSSPSSFLSTSSSSHRTAVFKGGNHTTSNHISSNNNVGGYDNAPDDDDDDDHYEEMHVLKKRKRCHTFAGNSVRLVS
ncbi:hypothetical protein HELRODRAFT_193571 [Helobdella robusta]|uniref:Uncharacterized protein n=1 Tax=Helobdella robusta TaxID=6412 RepID=T1FV50_HELRO|nr:hypothetical protein HELRODRAFT_193571 [Helobdella robusta]ESN95378.1 hypothetical protein HELRODRAFT_193571 [Helobdella robusta]